MSGWTDRQLGSEHAEYLGEIINRIRHLAIPLILHKASVAANQTAAACIFLSVLQQYTCRSLNFVTFITRNNMNTLQHFEKKKNCFLLDSLVIIIGFTTHMAC